MKGFFIYMYFMIALSTGFLILIDYPTCHRLYNRDKQPDSIAAGVSMVFGGLMWPISLPGMLILFDDANNNFCI